MEKINFLKRELTEDEISLINNTKIKDRSHPAKSIITYFDSHTELFNNTNNALSAVLQHDNNWFQNNKKRITEIFDYSTSSSFLAEIRTYGILIENHFNIKSIDETDESTPDFEILNDLKNERIIVEVNAKQYTKAESQALHDFHDRKRRPPLQPGVNVDEHVVTPFGKPRKNENVTENVISRLCSIKQEEKQFSKEEPSILWVDFQDELWDITLKPDSVLPIRSWNGGLYSGEIWYSLFGYKDAPIFEGETTKLRHKRETIRMRHDGRFRNGSIVDAVIYSFLGKIIAIENPYSQKSLPEWFWYKFIGIRNFQFELSLLNWPDNKLDKQIENQKIKLDKLGEQEWHSW